MKNSGFPNLRALRIDLEMTQEEFATSLGISKTTYNNYEIGTREPRSDFWEKVAQKYNVTVDYLLGLSSVRGTQKSPDPEEPETEDFDEEEFQLFCKAMVTLGYLREGEDFTDTQVQVLAGIIQILDATFPRFADGQLDEARTAG